MKILENLQTPQKSISLAEVSPAKTFQVQEVEQELTEKNQDYGLKCTVFVGKLDLNTLSLKTAQTSLFEDLNECYATFPKSGMMQNGNVYEVQTLGCPITETEFTVLPTICKQDGAGQVKSYLRTKETWESTSSLTCKMMAMQFGLQGNMPRPEGLFCINPKIAEMMMGYPNGWTELEV